MANNLLDKQTDEEKLTLVFKALSDPTRRAILKRLAHQPMSVGELSEPFKMAKPTISKHLKVLERADLLERNIDGRVHFCHLRPKSLSAATQWLLYYEQFWSEKFDSLETHLANLDDGDNK